MAQQDDKKVVDFNKVNTRKLHLEPLDADPADLRDGDMWYRGDTDVLHVYVNGAVKTVTVA